MIENLKKYETLDLQKTKFVGYEQLVTKSKVLGLFDSEYNQVKSLTGSGYIIFDQTPFYAMAGGQDSDKGIIVVNDKNKIELLNVRKDIIHDFYIHEVNLEESKINLSDELELKVDELFRNNSSVSHSALHIIGQEIINETNHNNEQLGSKVNNEKYQVQFVVDSRITEELVSKAVEQINKNIIPKNIESKIYSLTKQETIDKGYQFDFGKLKEDSTIRIVEFPTYTSEPCGGTHVKNTSEIKQIWFTNFDINAKRILIEFSSNIDYVTNLFNDKLVEIYNQIKSNVEKGIKLGFERNQIKNEIEVANKLSQNWDYCSIKEINVIYKNITGIVNKFIKTKEVEMLNNFISEDLSFETFGKFKVFHLSNEMYSNKILTGKGIKLSNESSNEVLVFINKFENGSNALLIRNKNLNFDLKELNQTSILTSTSFRGGGTDSMIQLVSQDTNDALALINLIKKLA